MCPKRRLPWQVSAIAGAAAQFALGSHRGVVEAVRMDLLIDLPECLRVPHQAWNSPPVALDLRAPFHVLRESPTDSARRSALSAQVFPGISLLAPSSTSTGQRCQRFRRRIARRVEQWNRHCLPASSRCARRSVACVARFRSSSHRPSFPQSCMLRFETRQLRFDLCDALLDIRDLVPLHANLNHCQRSTYRAPLLASCPRSSGSEPLPLSHYRGGVA